METGEQCETTIEKPPEEKPKAVENQKPYCVNA